MGFLETIFVVLLILKLTGVISIGWAVVCLPLIIAAVIYGIIFIFFGAVFTKLWRNNDFF